EIKNPLNFVNNFAGLSVELLDELKATAAPAIRSLDDEKRTEIDETIEMLTGNLEKIAEHDLSVRLQDAVAYWLGGSATDRERTRTASLSFIRLDRIMCIMERMRPRDST